MFFLLKLNLINFDVFSVEQDDKTFSILKKTLGSFLGDASDEDFPADD